ncbi:MAG: DUF2628 domain-containing protein [Alphaproteobacteria bacterium]|nr:DUF2628 domain-containing protein [Alphaproteobacteria bacterium]
MRVYSVHRRGADIVAVREGFSWFALVAPFLWALWHRMWIWGVAMLAVDLVLGGAWDHGWLDAPETAIIAVGVAFLFAAEAHDLYRRTLFWRGYAEEGLSTGRDADAAIRRWADRRGGWDSAFA